MSNELFTAVSVEEQEIVAGGVDAGTLSGSFYNALIANKSATFAGAKGAGTLSESIVKIESGAATKSFLFGF